MEAVTRNNSKKVLKYLTIRGKMRVRRVLDMLLLGVLTQLHKLEHLRETRIMEVEIEATFKPSKMDKSPKIEITKLDFQDQFVLFKPAMGHLEVEFLVVTTKFDYIWCSNFVGDCFNLN